MAMTQSGMQVPARGWYKSGAASSPRQRCSECVGVTQSCGMTDWKWVLSRARKAYFAVSRGLRRLGKPSLGRRARPPPSRPAVVRSRTLRGRGGLAVGHSLAAAVRPRSSYHTGSTGRRAVDDAASTEVTRRDAGLVASRTQVQARGCMALAI